MRRNHIILISISSVLVLGGIVALILYLTGVFDKSSGHRHSIPASIIGPSIPVIPPNTIDRCIRTAMLPNISSVTSSGHKRCHLDSDFYKNQSLCTNKCKNSSNFSCVTINMDDCTYKVKTDY